MNPRLIRLWPLSLFLMRTDPNSPVLRPPGHRTPVQSSVAHNRHTEITTWCEVAETMQRFKRQQPCLRKHMAFFSPATYVLFYRVFLHCLCLLSSFASFSVMSIEVVFVVFLFFLVSVFFVIVFCLLFLLLLCSSIILPYAITLKRLSITLHSSLSSIGLCAFKFLFTLFVLFPLNTVLN